MKVVFIVPALEIDASWDPARRAPHIGIWAMASLLKQHGHSVHYLDESMRDGAWSQRRLFRRQLQDAQCLETPLEVSWDQYQQQKRDDFQSLDPRQFSARYSAFRTDGFVDRVIARIGQPEDETLAYLEELQPDVVGIPLVATANYLPATRLGRMIKQRLPQVRLLFGGQHVTADPAGFLAANPNADYVACGDAITTIQGIVEATCPRGVVFGGFQLMDQYPMLDYSIISDAGYPSVPTHTFPSGLKCVEWMSSRGCYRNCAFCFAGRKEQEVTQLNQERLVAQLDHFVSQGIQEIVFQDDAWLYRAKERFPMLLALMKQRGLSFQNNGGVEFESFTGDVADLLISYNNGTPGSCTSLYIPFNPRGWNANETAAGSMTRRYHRNLECLRRVREAGVYVFTSLIIGTPEQTPAVYEEDLATLRDLIMEGYLDAALPLSATMLPGTEWYHQNGHNIVNPADWAGYSLFTTHHCTPFMSPLNIEERMVRTVKELGDLQRAEDWQTAFPRI